MEVTFGANQTPVAPVEATPPAASGSSVPATIPSGAVITRNQLLVGDTLPPLTELILPRINMAQNIGNLKDIFAPGSLVYNQTTVLFEPAKINPKTNTVEKAATPPVAITFLGFRPVRFVERTQGGVRGLIVNSEEAVVRANGTLDYQEWQLKQKDGVKYFQPMIDGLVAVERPIAYASRTDEPDFVYEINGKHYTLAMWSIAKTAYTELFRKVLAPARQLGCLKTGYPAWAFNISTREKTYSASNKSWIPIAVPREKNNDEFWKFVRQVLETPSSSAPAGN